ncbi:MAG: cell division protein FtsL [Treponema sp.]|nr:cell division protein FtsL [Treponema sp.]
MKIDVSGAAKTLLVCFFALSVPALLVIDGIHARKYTDLEKQVEELEKRQKQLIEENKKLITDISLLSSSERIEGIARDSLGMREAESDEIVRVEMSSSSSKKAGN